MKIKLHVTKTLIFAAVLASLPLSATAQSLPEPLVRSIQQAINVNPDVQSRWNDFLAAGYERDATRGGFFPKLDLQLGVGRDYDDFPDLDSESYTRRGAGLSLSQMIYDGGFTSSETRRFGHARTVRYFELLNEVENVGMEVVRAYNEVLKFRELVQFAKENYVEHKLIHDQIVQRTSSGVGRGVDLDLATGRLALAEANLLTEATNLHDISARFVRIVGEAPAAELGVLSTETLAQALPATREEALNIAHGRNPAIRAAVADVRASQDLVESRRSFMRPRLDILARQDIENNRDGVDGNTREGRIELVLNYNLYNGGSDQARINQAAEGVNAAWNVREKVCRDVRQTLSIAFNDIASLTEQLDYLDQHQLSIEKARSAYRQQFDIGQRTLLDLLDNENEYFDARRSYTSARYNLISAHARSLAAMGELLTTLQIRRDNLPEVSDVAATEDYEDAETVCPPLTPDMPTIDKAGMVAETLKAVGVKP